MSATIRKAPRRPGYQAWCGQCQDGVNTKSRSKAEEWAEKHNAEKHPEPDPCHSNHGPQSSCTKCEEDPW